MITYQDFLSIGENVSDDVAMNFVYGTIFKHKTSDMYKTAVLADEYCKRRNRTIVQYQKLLYTISGKAVPDNYSANYKLCSNFFDRFITQENQYLLGNGVTWEDDATRDKLGEDFDTRLQEAGKYALVDGVSFGFFNLDKLQVFRLKEFVPLLDEEDGSIKAGVRFWQIDEGKPLRATFYELDGYTDYIWNRRKDKDGNTKVTGEVLHKKRPYKIKVRYSEADGLEIFDGENYPTFPIVPLWGNPHHQSEFTGLQEAIDAYDLIKSGFCNTVDEASLVYWTLSNSGGMDDIDLVEFVEHMKTVHASVTDGDAEAHTLEPPFASREAVLTRIRNDLFDDAMALDTKEIAGGAATATQIRAAYEPLNNKTDQFEYCVLDFLKGIMLIAGIEDNPTFTRSKIVNVDEEMRSVITAAEYLDSEYVTRKVLTLFGDGDKAEEVLERMEQEQMEIMMAEEEETEEPEGEPEEPEEEPTEDDFEEDDYDYGEDEIDGAFDEIQGELNSRRSAGAEEQEDEELEDDDLFDDGLDDTDLEPLDEEDDEIDRLLDELLDELNERKKRRK